MIEWGRDWRVDEGSAVVDTLERNGAVDTGLTGGEGGGVEGAEWLGVYERCCEVHPAGDT